MLVSIGLYAFIAKDHGPTPKEVSLIFVCMMAALAAGMIAATLVVRRVLVKPAESTLAANPENAAALHRWRTGYIATYALSEAVVLYGVVLRFMGLSFSQVIPFFVAGFVLTLFFAPRRPTNAIG